MATITNFLAKPPPYLASLTKINPFNPNSSSYHLSFFPKPRHPATKLETRPTLFVTKATAASKTDKKKAASDERIQQVHSIQEFDEALRMAKNKLVVVEYAASHSKQSSKIYPFMVNLSRTCSDVEFLLVMGDESEETRELCTREKIDKVPHFSFYKSMEKIHEEEGIGPDQLVGDVLYYGDNHSAVVQLHSREDVEKLIEDHKTDNKLIVLDVGLKHCGPCVKVYPTVIKLSKQMTDTVVFARMNGDENESCMAFLKEMEVVEVPTFLFIREGEICGRNSEQGPSSLFRSSIGYNLIHTPPRIEYYQLVPSMGIVNEFWIVFSGSLSFLLQKSLRFIVQTRSMASQHPTNQRTHAEASNQQPQPQEPPPYLLELTVDINRLVDQNRQLMETLAQHG